MLKEPAKVLVASLRRPKCRIPSGTSPRLGRNRRPAQRQVNRFSLQPAKTMLKVLALAGLGVSAAFLGASPVRNAPQQLQAAAVLDAPVAAASAPVVGFSLDGSAVFGK